MKKFDEKNVAENPLYHDTWKLLKKYRDVVWSLELSVQHVRTKFEIEYGTSIEDFLDSVYLAGADLAGSDIEHHAKCIERSHKMLKLLDSAVDLLRTKHKNGEAYYASNLSTFLGDGLLQNMTEWTGNSIPSLGDVTFTDGVTPVVYYNQLDERYASQPYGTDNIGGYGCGPTSMAIVVSSLTDDTVDPVEMAQWSYENGYWCDNSGSYHALIPAAAEAWGLPVSGCTTSEPQRIVDALSEGKLVVAIMAEGHFTSSGHFIVLRGVKDGQIMVADPASYKRSEQLWDLSIILNEASRRAGAGGPFWIIG